MPSPCPLLCTWHSNHDTSWEVPTHPWVYTVSYAFRAHPSHLHDELLKNPEKVSPPPRSPPRYSQKLSSPGLIMYFVHISGSILIPWLIWGTCLSKQQWTSQGQGQCEKHDHFHPTATDSEKCSNLPRVTQLGLRCSTGSNSTDYAPKTQADFAFLKQVSDACSFLSLSMSFGDLAPEGRASKGQGAGDFMWDLKLYSLPLSGPQLSHRSVRGLGQMALSLLWFSPVGTCGSQLLGDFVRSITHALPKELNQAVEVGREKNGSFTQAVCMGPVLSPEEVDSRR